MTETTTDTLTRTVETYLSTWNETDPASRARIIADVWVDDGRYVDPLQEATGHAELSEIVGNVHAQFPGQRFRRTTAVDEHHGLVRFGWELFAEDGTVSVAGTDFGVLAADGRLRSITGFFGDLAPA